MKNKINKDLLYSLYTIHSPSGSERKIKKFIKSYIRINIPGCDINTDNAGNLYIKKGCADSYPCVVAHLDQVQHIHSKDFTVMECGDIVFGYSPTRKQTEGLGADDKNGIFIALECLKMFDTIKVALFVKEEIGCIGSSDADINFFNDCRFVIEPDRRGNNDLVTEAAFTELCSKEFVNDIISLSDYKVTSGLCTDVMALKEKGLEVSSINLSCGYYNPHTDFETTDIKDLQKSLIFVQLIIKNTQKTYPHEYIDYFSYENNYYEDYEYASEFLDDLSREDIDVQDLTTEQIVESLEAYSWRNVDRDAVKHAYDDFIEYNKPKFIDI